MARQTAKKASIYIGGVKVGDAYDITYDISNKFEDASAFGDTWELPESTGPSSWKASAKRYHTSGAATFMASAIADPDTQYTVIFYQEDGVTGSRVFQGTCKIESANGGLPKAGLRDEGVNFIGYGAPTFPA